MDTLTRMLANCALSRAKPSIQVTSKSQLARFRPFKTPIPLAGLSAACLHQFTNFWELVLIIILIIQIHNTTSFIPVCVGFYLGRSLQLWCCCGLARIRSPLKKGSAWSPCLSSAKNLCMYACNTVFSTCICSSYVLQYLHTLSDRTKRFTQTPSVLCFASRIHRLFCVLGKFRVPQVTKRTNTLNSWNENVYFLCFTRILVFRYHDSSSQQQTIVGMGSPYFISFEDIGSSPY